ncbi:MAG TPA: hypothetical protein VGP72_32065 [Planctomycetota bacterium]|jgi:hypothetical protein
MSLYSDLQGANLAASVAVIKAMGTTVQYQHKAESPITVIARFLPEVRRRSLDQDAKVEEMTAVWEIPQQTSFPPLDGIVSGDLIIDEGHKYSIQESTDIAGLRVLFRVTAVRSKPQALTQEK